MVALLLRQIQYQLEGYDVDKYKQQQQQQQTYLLTFKTGVDRLSYLTSDLPFPAFLSELKGYGFPIVCGCSLSHWAEASYWKFVLINNSIQMTHAQWSFVARHSQGTRV